MPFVGCSPTTGLNFGGYECGIFHVHIGMAGYGSYEQTGSPLTEILDYHADDQAVSSSLYWGCPMYGCTCVDPGNIGSTGCGTFVDWKMSGSHYSGYADYRVGSPITIMSVYHDYSGDGGNSYWPVFGCKWASVSSGGIFHDNDTSMSGRPDTAGSLN